MKKTLTFIAAFLMSAVMASAENSFTGHQVAEATESNISDAATDQAFLQNKKALFDAPDPEADKNIKFWAQAVASRVKVMAYAQGGYTAKFQSEAGVKNSNTFDMKRVILMTGVDVTKDFYAFFMHDFKSGNMQEYYLEYRPLTEIKVRAGQFKKEFSMENPMSPTVLESIGPMSQGVFWLNGFDPLINNACGRDIGIMVYGDLFNNKLRYAFEVVNGGQINSTDKNTQKDVIGKLEYKPIPNLRFSLSGQLGHGYAVKNSVYNNTVKEGQTYRSDRWAFGVEYKTKKAGTNYNDKRCATFRSEILGGRDGGVHSYGAYLSTAIPVYKRLDVVGMVDFFNKNVEAGYQQTNLMAGIQYWMHTKCRIQLQYTHNLKSKNLRACEKAAKVADMGNAGQLQAQLQVAF